MADLPKDLLDQIIAFRDNQPTSAEFRRQLTKDGDAQLELADARLLSLALSLLGPRELDQDEACPPDDRLCLYLLNQLPNAERDRLEDSLRGNSSALHRLLELRSAIADLAAADDRAPLPWKEPPSRENLGVVQFRKSATVIEFQRHVYPPRDYRVARLSSDIATLKEAAEFLPKKTRPGPWRTVGGRPRRIPPEVEYDLASLEFNIARLSEFTRQLRAMIQQSRRDKSDMVQEFRVSHGFEVEQQLRDALQSLPPKLGYQLEEQLRRLTEVAWDYLHQLDEASFGVEVEPLTFPAAASVSLASQDVEDDWQTMLALRGQAGTLRLEAASALAHEQDKIDKWHFSVTVLQLDDSPAPNTLVTVVKRDSGFDSVETDIDGKALLPLRGGESVLIVGTDPSMEVTLREQDSAAWM